MCAFLLEMQIGASKEILLKSVRVYSSEKHRGAFARGNF